MTISRFPQYSLRIPNVQMLGGGLCWLGLCSLSLDGKYLTLCSVSCIQKFKCPKRRGIGYSVYVQARTPEVWIDFWGTLLTNTPTRELYGIAGVCVRESFEDLLEKSPNKTAIRGLEFRRRGLGI